jgi:hypothetical protein
MDDFVRKKEKMCRQTIEKRSACRKRKWKTWLSRKHYFMITLAQNKENLFEIVNTKEMFFRYYGHTDIYIVGVSKDYDGAVEILTQILTKGYDTTPDYNPRNVFTKEKFHVGKN